MALSSTVQALRAGVLRHIRLPVQQVYAASGSKPSLALNWWRGFAGGGYLDKDEVTQRVLDVTKHFEKIDPAKVPCSLLHHWVAAVLCSCCPILSGDL